MEHHACGTIFDKTGDMGGQRNPSAEYRICQIPWIRRRSPRIVLISCFSLLHHREHKIMHICIRWMQKIRWIFMNMHICRASLFWSLFWQLPDTCWSVHRKSSCAIQPWSVSSSEMHIFSWTWTWTFFFKQWHYNTFRLHRMYCVVYWVFLGMDTQLNPFPREI